MVGCALSIFQQLSGINALIFYSSKIFSTGDDDFQSAKEGTVILNVFNVVSAMSAIFLLRYLGRKTLLLTGHLMMGVLLAIVGVFFKLDKTNLIKGFTYAYVCFF